MRRVLASLVFACVVGEAYGSQSFATPPSPGVQAELAATISFLTSEKLAGRSAATEGGALTASYLATRLAEIGWLPAGDETPSGRSFFQSVAARRARYDPDGTWIEASTNDGSLRVRLRGSASTDSAKEPDRRKLSIGELRVVPDRAETVEVAGRLAFAGFGIEAPEYRHDDYAGLDVHGKIVLVFSGEPGETDPRSPWNGARATRHATVSQKRRLAASLGAAALLVVPNPAGRSKTTAELLKGREHEMTSPWLGLADDRQALPLVYLDPDAVGMLLEGSRFKLERASKKLEGGKSASRIIDDRTIRLRIATRDRRDVTLQNVVARLGSGVPADAPVVVIGAHWDGLGTAEGKILPGADDNASGVAALLAAARALEEDPPSAPGEIIAAFWTGEESGLLGSRWFAAHPVVPLARIKAVVNLDMLGRNNLDRKDYENVLQLIYSAQAPSLREIAGKANDGIGLDLRFYGALRFQPISDHATFADAGVPIVYPFSGYHGDYHGPGDTLDKLSLPRIARTADYVARLLRLLVERAGSIRLDPTIESPPSPDPFDRPMH